MQPSPISLLIKREFVNFERVPMARPGVEPGRRIAVGPRPTDSASKNISAMMFLLDINPAADLFLAYEV